MRILGIKSFDNINYSTNNYDLYFSVKVYIKSMRKFCYINNIFAIILVKILINETGIFSIIIVDRYLFIT